MVRRSFSREFKLEAVRLVRERGDAAHFASRLFTTGRMCASTSPTNAADVLPRLLALRMIFWSRGNASQPAEHAGGIAGVGASGRAGMVVAQRRLPCRRSGASRGRRWQSEV